MFNAWPLNGAGLNAGSSGVRVLFASAVLVASGAVSAEPTRTVMGSMDLVGQAIGEVTRADARRRARAEGFITAGMDVDRPYDLLWLTLDGRCQLEPEHLVTRFGAADARVRSWFDRTAIVHRFFALMEGAASMDPADGWAIRPGHSALGVGAEFEPYATRIQRGWASALVVGSFEANDAVFAGGVTWFEGSAALRAGANVNGVHESASIMEARCEVAADGDRRAGGRADGVVLGEFVDLEAEPGRGVAPTTFPVTASMAAVWWTFVHEEAEFPAGATIVSAPHRVRPGQAVLDSRAEGEAHWSRIVEPRERIVMATAVLEGTPLRRRHSRVDATARSWFEGDGRIVIRGAVDAQTSGSLTVYERLAHRGQAESVVVAVLEPTPWRIAHAHAVMDGYSELIRVQASVNLLNPAPEWRRMIVPKESRAMVVPYENRTMVVR